MNKLISLNFPDTSLYSETQYPFLLFFDQLHFINPIENNDIFDSNHIFAEHGLCQEDTPKPLGNDRDRFIHLIKDILTRKDDYLTQLNLLTLAQYSSSSDKQRESRTEIMSSILGPGVSAITDEKETATELLWRARLLLLLGQKYDMEEEELASHLQVLDDKEIELFKKLQGNDEEEQDNPFSEIMELQKKTIKQNASMIYARCREWMRLLEDTPLENSQLLVTTKQDAFDYCSDNFEKQYNSLPQYIDALPLPAYIGREAEGVIEKVQQFKENNAELIKMLQQQIIPLLEQEYDRNERTGIDDKLLAKWEEALEQQFPENISGRKQLKLFQFARFRICAVTNRQSVANSLLFLLQ